MEFMEMLGDAFEYTRSALVGKWMRWLILAVVSLIPIVNLILGGYIARIYRGARVAPDIGDDYVALWVDGLKLAIVAFIYFIPVGIVGGLLGLAGVVAFPQGDNSSVSYWIAALGTMAIAGIVVFIVALVVGLIQQMALVRFARADDFGEAFNFSAILAHIGRIGWGSYIVALIVLYVALFAVGVVLSILGVLTFGLGFLLFFALAPAFSIFVARYAALIYDSVPAPA